MPWLVKNQLLFFGMKNICLFLLLLCLVACQLDSQKNNRTSKEAFKFAINPSITLEHAYDIENETEFETEVDGKEVRNVTKSTIGAVYKMRRDSLDNYIIDITYDKILLHTKNGQEETELSADNGTYSVNPVEKLLGHLKGAKLTAVLNQKGETKEIRGYKELGDKIMASFAKDDIQGKAMAQKQWEGMMRQQLVDNNLGQLFKIFPDSLVHVGDQWKITTQQKEHFNLKVDNTYILEEIDDKIASIRVTGKIQSDNNSASLSGYQIATDLSGEQKGEYKVDLATGMPIKSVLESITEGKIHTMGREVPIKIENKVTIQRRK